MSRRINCKVHDEHERVIEVGVEDEGKFPWIAVWKMIKEGRGNFHTFEEGKWANVKAIERGQSKYLTTHPDGITENNLDELKSCPI